MFKITVTGVLTVMLGVFLGCSQTPLHYSSDLFYQNQQNVEFAALEMEIEVLNNEYGTLDNDVRDLELVQVDWVPDGRPIEFTDGMKEQLGLIIVHLRRVQERLTDYENRFPNKDVRALLEETTTFMNAAIEAFAAGEFADSFNAFHDAREKMRSALENIR